MKRFLPLSLVLAVICTACHYEHYPPEYYKSTAKVAGFNLVHVDNAGERRYDVWDESPVAKEAYVLKVRILLSDYEDLSYPFHTEYKIALTEPIEQITVVTLNDFDADHPTGSDVTACFKAFQAVNPVYNGQAAFSPLPMADIENIANSDLLLALLTVPQPGEHRFEVTLALKRRGTLTETTPTVILE